MSISHLLRRAAAVSLGAVLIGTLGVVPIGTLGVTSAEAAGKHSHPSAKPIDVRVIAFNDLHGNLQPPTGSSGRVVDDSGTAVDAGGAAYLAAHVNRLKSQVKNSFVVSAGDSIGASPLASAVFHDEPTIAAMNAMKVKAMAVGNHEFDEGYAELLRIQRGGCHPVDGCDFDRSYRGAKFPILGANVRFAESNRPALLPFTVVRSGGVNIGVIGLTLEDLPSVVVPSAIVGLEFGDEVQAIDKTSRVLQQLGIKSQVVVMHQGDSVTNEARPNSCSIVPGIADHIARTATARVDAFIEGHSHQGYNCTVPDPNGKPRPVTQSASFGRMVSSIDLRIDPRTRDVIRTAGGGPDNPVAHNTVVTRDITPDPAVGAIVDRAVSLSAPLANRPVGSITGDLLRAPNAAGESTLGDVIADAQLEGTRSNGAQIAMTNPGGIRTDLPFAPDNGVVTYGEAFAVQPFSNFMLTITLTGAQLKAVLEQQWQPTTTRFLQVSAGFSYTWSASAPVGSKVSELELDGTPINPAASYRVSVNNFLATGGDGFGVFTQGTDAAGGPVDLDAFTAYLTANSPVSPPPLDRITLVP